MSKLHLALILWLSLGASQISAPAQSSDTSQTDNILFSQPLLTGKLSESAPPAAPTRLRLPRPWSVEQNQKALAHDLIKAGVEKHRLGLDIEAEAKFREALSCDPTNANAHFNLAALAEGRGDRAAALDQYRSALALDPADQSTISAIHELEASVENRSLFKEPNLFQGRSVQAMFSGSTNILADQSEFPPTAPQRGRLTAYPFHSGITSSAPLISSVSSASRSSNNQSHTMHTLANIGIGVLSASLSRSLFSGRPMLDTCACPILHF